MEEFFKNLPKLISESSKSTLGIISLSIIALTFLAYIFFKDSSSKIKKSIFLIFLLSLACFVALIFFKYPGSTNKSLKEATNNFITVSNQIIKEQTVIPNKPLPTSFSLSRSSFESAWTSASLADKVKIQDSLLFGALINNIRIYRIQETYEAEKPNSNEWSDAAIEYFKNSNNNKFFCDMLLEKAGIILEMSQLNRSDKILFRSLVTEGNNIMMKVFSLQDKNSKGRILRIWSRFYYDLSKPADNIFSDNWDNTYLKQAYQKSIDAFNIDTMSLKSSTQLCRCLQKLAGNSPQDNESKWTPIMRKAFDWHVALWGKSNKKLTDYSDRIPPLNILGVLGIETVYREWNESDKKQQSGNILLKQIESTILPAQEETITLVESSEFKKDYSSDVNIDLAKIHTVYYQIIKRTDSANSELTFKNVLTDFEKARAAINNMQQLDALKSYFSNSKLYSDLDSTKRNTIKYLLYK